jgi:V8-like Glu-specific endopeptidase
MSERNEVGDGLAFYQPAKVAGASEFAKEFKKSLACGDVKALGHRFRLIQEDPLAQRLEARRAAGGPAPGAPTTKGAAAGAASVARQLPEIVELADGIRNYVPVCFLELGLQNAKAVCKIEATGTNYKNQPDQEWTGTGFLVGPNLLLTNHHVLNSIDVARDALCVFNYQLGVQFSPLETVGIKLDPSRLFVTSPLDGGLDFTFVWIESSAHAAFGSITMHRSAFTVHNGDFANVIQHPRGDPKAAVLQDNRVLQDTGIVLHYTSDTDRGSSGAPVFNNRWELIGLHRASVPNTDKLALEKALPPPAFLNEGVKISAIAADLERRSQAGEPQAMTVLGAFGGVDSLMGLFGGLGRTASPGTDDRARLVELYASESEDVDAAFWHVAWLNERYDERVPRVAAVIADLNIDVWTLFDCADEASAALVQRLEADFKLTYQRVSCPQAGNGERRPTAVIWNTRTLEAVEETWPAEIQQWFTVRSSQFPDLQLEGTQGPVFDVSPRLLRLRARERRENCPPYDLRLVPLHLGVAADAFLRRKRALSILAAALDQINPEAEHDILIGGRFDAGVAREEFHSRLDGRMATLCAGSEDHGAVTYLKSRRSPLGRIFLSPNIQTTFGSSDLFMRAAGKLMPKHVADLSMQEPVAIRLSLLRALEDEAALPQTLTATLRGPHSRASSTPEGEPCA